MIGRDHDAVVSFFFFFNDTATTEIYTLSLHDALPISLRAGGVHRRQENAAGQHYQWDPGVRLRLPPDRKRTRLNSSHSQISYAVFCLKKKKRCYWRALASSPHSFSYSSDISTGDILPC